MTYEQRAATEHSAAPLTRRQKRDAERAALIRAAHDAIEQPLTRRERRALLLAAGADSVVDDAQQASAAPVPDVAHGTDPLLADAPIVSASVALPEPEATLRELDTDTAERVEAVPGATSTDGAEGAPSAPATPVVRGATSGGPSLGQRYVGARSDETAGESVMATRRSRRAATRPHAAAPSTLTDVVDVSTASIVSSIDAAASSRAAQERRAAQLRMQAARIAATKRAVRTAPDGHAPSKPRQQAFGLAAPSLATRRRTAKLGGLSGLLLVGGLIAATTLPAQAFQAWFDEQPQTIEYGEVQSLGADGSEAALAEGDSFAVADAVASTAFTADEQAALQAIANGETPGDATSGSPAYPATWAALETSYLQTPFPGRDVPVGSPFAARWGTWHYGADYNPGVGTPIFPIANGVVSHIEQGTGSGGYMVWIDHNIDGTFYQSWYAHMIEGSISVELGQVVDITTQLGLVGSTGFSTGPHLHLEIKNPNRDSIDPQVFLATRQEVTAG